MNEKVIGLMKDELGGKIISEFVALGPKTYYYSTDNDKNVKKAKGAKKRVIRKYLSLMIIKIAYFKMKSY